MKPPQVSHTTLSSPGGTSASSIRVTGALVIGLAFVTACDVRSGGSATIDGRAPAVSSHTSPDPRLLLPDLRIRSPRELRVTMDARTRERQIRFSTTVFNVGRGPLEIRGVNDPVTRRTVASQRIRTIDASTTTRIAGNFVFHPDHDHWHFEDFTSFEMWTHAADGTLQRMITTTGKMSFCIWDSDRMDDQPQGAPTRGRYERCPQDLQGLSVGWNDMYPARIPGQHLTIDGIPDGRYAIRSTVDPENRLMESNEGNNDVIVYVRLSGSTIERVDPPQR